MRGGGVIRACLLVALAAPVAGAQDRPAEDVRAAVQRVLSRGRYQTELPGGEPADATRLDPGRSPRRPWRDGVAPLDTGGGSDAGAGGAAVAAAGGAMLLWGFVAVLIAVALGALLLMAWRGGAAGARAPPAEAAAPGEVAALPATAAAADPGDAPLRDAERLAAEGRFAEAIHVLLLRTLQALAAHRGRALPVAQTSRRVLATLQMAEAPRTALAGLVHAVEWCRFAGRPATAGDFGACRSQFAAFRDACRA